VRSHVPLYVCNLKIQIDVCDARSTPLWVELKGKSSGSRATLRLQKIVCLAL
jgi:hypothetical protein